MAIKGGNPLFKVETLNGAGDVICSVRTTYQDGTIMVRDISRDDPLLVDYVMFGAETKFRNTIGAVSEANRTPEGAKERGGELYAAHDAGEWNIGREAGDGAPSGGLVARAVAEVLGKDVGTVVAHIRGQFSSIEDEKKRVAAVRKAWSGLEGDEQFKPTVERLRAEDKARRDAKVKVDAKANAHLLAGLKAA